MKGKSFAKKDTQILVDALSGKLDNKQNNIKLNLNYPLCDCLTKTPELKYHHKNCKYRMWNEREELAKFVHSTLLFRFVPEEAKTTVALNILTRHDEELFRD